MNPALERHHDSVKLPAMAGKPKTRPLPKDPVKLRLLILQLALDGENRAAFGRRVGLSPQQLYNYLNTGQPVTLPSLQRIKQRTGVDYAWFLDGDESKLPVEVFEKIKTAAATLEGERSADPPRRRANARRSPAASSR